MQYADWTYKGFVERWQSQGWDWANVSYLPFLSTLPVSSSPAEEGLTR